MIRLPQPQPRAALFIAEHREGGARGTEGAGREAAPGPAHCREGNQNQIRWAVRGGGGGGAAGGPSSR